VQFPVLVETWATEGAVGVVSLVGKVGALSVNVSPFTIVGLLFSTSVEPEPVVVFPNVVTGSEASRKFENAPPLKE
jgi:hypothetical protein